MANQEWQPIETAPRDGDEIMVYGPHGHGCLVACYAEAEGDPAYCWLTLEGLRYPNAAFTHWMPLPALPSPEELPCRDDTNEIGEGGVCQRCNAEPTEFCLAQQTDGRSA